MLGITYTHTHLADGRVRVNVKPPEWAHVGDGASIDLTSSQFTRYLDWKRTGKKIQDVLPELSDEEREILMTGIGPTKWNELFPEVD